MTDEYRDSSGGIAVIGMQARFPGAPSVDAFWDNLCAGVESVSFFSDDELRASGVPESMLTDPDYVRASAILDDVDLFDAAFFGVPPAEAEILDPQQRVFLDICWEALERSGHEPGGSTEIAGVFAGSGMNTYVLNYLMDRSGMVHLPDVYQLMLGNERDFLPTRVSYKLDLRGPSVNVQTACSTSLMAVHLACQSLESGECDLALAGGVSIAFPQKVGYLYAPGMILSPDGHCRAFDARAQGIVGGNGAGVVVLRRLEEAIADGDTIHAVIRGSAANNDGAGKAGFTAPSMDGQAAVIAEALAMAGIDPESIGYVEAHGTGTAIGDPIEIAALEKAFATERTRFCALGSVKTNFGHLNAAAGIAGLIKCVLTLRHGRIPPSLHFERPNPVIDFARSPFFINDRLRDFPSPAGTLRRAGVSSFGIGGTNVHVVLEQAPPQSRTPAAKRPCQLLVLSARTESGLNEQARNLAGWLGQHEGEDTALQDTAYTLALGRKVFEHRGYVVCRERADAVAGLSGLSGDVPAGAVRRVTGAGRTGEQELAFLFSGQGAQYLRMGRELYESEVTFRENVDHACSIIQRSSGVDLRDILYPRELSGPEEARAEARLNRTEHTQPALFVVSHALARLWQSWGVKPRAYIGHSVGELVAACLAEVMSLDQALTLIVARGKLMQSMREGAMLSVALAEDEVGALLSDQVALAAINGPEQCVLSGDSAAIAAIKEHLDLQGVPAIPLNTSHAFHSHLCDDVLAEFRAQVAQITLQPPAVPFISNVTGTWITDEQATSPDYWVDHLRRTVRFADGISALIARGIRVFIEMGPGRTLANLARQHPGIGKEHAICSSLPDRKARGAELAFLLDSLGQVWGAGVSIDWRALYQGVQPQRIELPTYPFARKRFWARAPAGAGPQTGVHAAKTAKDGRLPVDEWFYGRVWERDLVPSSSDLGAAHTWLVFADARDVAPRLGAGLEALGHTVVIVRAGRIFVQEGARAFAIDPLDLQSYRTLFAHLERASLSPDRIINLWALDAAGSDIEGDIAFASLLHLGKVLGSAWSDAEPGANQIVIVTAGVHAVTGQEALQPRQATVLGPSLVLPQEYPPIVCRAIDIAIAVDRGVQDRELEHLLVELGAGDRAPMVALRGGRRWLPQVRRVAMPRVRHTGDAGNDRGVRAVRLRDSGVYLITGGLGGMGLALARGIARAIRGPRLVLVSRSAVENDARGSQVRRELEALGADVTIRRADVTDAESLRAVVSETLQRFGAISGVIHAAGIVASATIEQKSLDQAEQVMAAKVRGTEILDHVLADTPLEFLALCSSLASVLGGMGLVDYCAGNAFLDAFATQRNATRAGLTVAIDWDGWHEIGMAAPGAVSESERKRRAAALPGAGITAEEGMDAFVRIIARELEQVMVSTADLGERIVRERSARQHMGADESEAALPRPEHPRPNLSTAYVAPRDPTEELLAAIWCEVLGIDRVGVNDSFFELGASSFLMIQAHGKLRKRLRELDQTASLAVSDLFEHPNISGLAARLRPRTEQGPDRRDQARERAERQKRALDAERRRAGQTRRDGNG